MRLNNKLVNWLVAVFAGMAMAFGIACGGDESPRKIASEEVEGVGFKGPVVGGDITVWGLAGNTRVGETQLGLVVKTGDDGTYKVDFLFTGNVLVELAGGTYTDEATGQVGVALAPLTLHALVPNVSGSVSAMVTPFTEIAYRLWKELLDEDGELTISQANAIAAFVAGTANILDTKPVLVTDEECLQALPSQIGYGLAAAMLSQYANTFPGLSPSEKMDAAIDAIANDLLDNMQLNATGDDLLDALEDFLKNEGQNPSGITLGETFIDDAIQRLMDEPYEPGDPDADTGGVAKAKRLVSDLRESALFVYDYTGSGRPGLMHDFYTRVADDIRENFPSEMLSERILTLIKAAEQVDVDALRGGEAQEVEVDDITVTFEYDDETEEEITLHFEMGESNPGFIGEGTITYAYDDMEIPEQEDEESDWDYFLRLLDSDLLPSEESITGEFTFETTEIDVDVSVTLDSSGTPPRTLTMTLVGATTVTTDNGETPLLDTTGTTEITINVVDIDENTIYFDQLTFNGDITLGTTAKIEGGIDITFPEGVSSNANILHELLPNKIVVDGTITELDSDTPVAIEGNLTAEWTNADTFDTHAERNEDNYEQWSVEFNGTISRTGIGEVTVLLGAEQTEWGIVDFWASYTRTKGVSTVFLQGGGTYDTEENTASAEFDNNEGMKVVFEDVSPDNVTGTITTAGGEEVAEIYLQNGMPMVKYADGFFESFF